MTSNPIERESSHTCKRRSPNFVCVGVGSNHGALLSPSAYKPSQTILTIVLSPALCLSGFVCLRLNLSVYVSASVCHVSVCVCLCISVTVYVCLALSMSICICLYLFDSVCICLYLCLLHSVGVVVCVSVCLSVCPSERRTSSVGQYIHLGHRSFTEYPIRRQLRRAREEAPG